MFSCFSLSFCSSLHFPLEGHSIHLRMNPILPSDFLLLHYLKGVRLFYLLLCNLPFHSKKLLLSFLLFSSPCWLSSLVCSESFFLVYSVLYHFPLSDLNSLLVCTFLFVLPVLLLLFWFVVIPTVLPISLGANIVTSLTFIITATADGRKRHTSK